MTQQTNEQGAPFENDEAVTLTKEQLAELVFVSAGAATAPLLHDHPDYVFPSERVTEQVRHAVKDTAARLGVDLDMDRIRGFQSRPIRSELADVAGGSSGLAAGETRG